MLCCVGRLLEPWPHISPPGSEVLVRVFGAAGDAVCDRQSENSLFRELASAGLGPNL